MQFIDEAKIFVKSGNGGNGCVSFRREANVPLGGPDGGNGGRGGNIIFRTVSNLNTLIDFRYSQHFKARSGEGGRGKNQQGKAGEDIIINVPIGTQIFSDNQHILFADMLEDGQEMVFLKGGDGGFGNAHFKSSTNRAPRKFTHGSLGEESWVWLKLKILSDVGLVGLPNAGKSTFLSKVSKAKPKIANYPFTTLKPMLGVVNMGFDEFVIADIPGLIEGAHLGVGLGHRFLKHVERCKIILHLIDATSDDIISDYQTIRNELESYSELLLNKKEFIVLTKSDLFDDDIMAEKKKGLLEYLRSIKKEGLAEDLEIKHISAITGENLDKVNLELLQYLNDDEN